MLFGAVNSTVYSYLILAYSDVGKVSRKVGFTIWQMREGGWLTGTILSGWRINTIGLIGVYWFHLF